MSTFTFMRKFMSRWVLAMALLATPSILLASDGSDSEDGGHGGHSGTHLNLQLSDQALTELTALLSQMNFSGSCSNGTTPDATGG